MKAQLTLPQSSSSQSGMALFEKIEFYLLAIGFSTFIYFPNILLISLIIIKCGHVFFKYPRQKYEKKLATQLRNLTIFICLFITLNSIIHASSLGAIMAFKNYTIYLIFFLILTSCSTLYKYQEKIILFLLVSMIPFLVIFLSIQVDSSLVLFFKKFINIYPNGFGTIFFHMKNGLTSFITTAIILSVSYLLKFKKHYLALISLDVILFTIVIIQTGRAALLGIIIGMVIIMITNGKKKIGRIKLQYITISLIIISCFVFYDICKQKHHHLIQNLNFLLFNTNPAKTINEINKKNEINKLYQQAAKNSYSNKTLLYTELNNIAHHYGFNSWNNLKRISIYRVSFNKNPRLALYHEYFLMAISRPLLGWGWLNIVKKGNEKDLLWDFKNSNVYKRDNFIEKTLYQHTLQVHESPHNLLLSYLLKGGWPMLILYLTFYTFILKSIFGSSTKFKYYLAPLITLFITLLFDFIYLSPRVMILFSLLLALNVEGNQKQYV